MVRSQDANGNVMGRSHTNPTLDTRTYQVDFTGGKVTELTTNLIAESMYSQCNAEENEFLPLNALVDYQKDDKAVSLSDQQITVWNRQVPIRPLQAGKYAAGGKTAPSPGRSCPN